MFILVYTFIYKSIPEMRSHMIFDDMKITTMRLKNVHDLINIGHMISHEHFKLWRYNSQIVKHLICIS